MTEPLPLSLLNDYLYCPRRAALKAVEGWRSANQHTARGDIVHEHADLAGYDVVKGTTLLRALPVWSERLGLNGKCDIVEVVGPMPDLKSEIHTPPGPRAHGLCRHGWCADWPSASPRQVSTPPGASNRGSR